MSSSKNTEKLMDYLQKARWAFLQKWLLERAIVVLLGGGSLALFSYNWMRGSLYIPITIGVFSFLYLIYYILNLPLRLRDIALILDSTFSSKDRLATAIELYSRKESDSPVTRAVIKDARKFLEKANPATI